jgi:hypothetical protein
MIPLAIGVAILDEHTSFARLETDGTPLLTALGAAVDCCIVTSIHPDLFYSPLSEVFKFQFKTVLFSLSSFALAFRRG